MEFLFELLTPDATFWEAYTDLWENSKHQSSFQAPRFIQFLLGLVLGPTMVYRCYRDGRLLGAAFFYKKGNTFQFLSDMKTDHNYFLIRKDASPEETDAYFQGLVQEVEKRHIALRLNNQPSWASYMDSLTKALSASGLYWNVAEYNPCLVLETETPEGMVKATNKQKLRQKLHRLEDIDQVEFETLHGNEDLDHWLEEFYDCHIRRWADTPTPSQYQDNEKKDFYKACLETWIEEGIAVRFAIKLGARRIAFVTALLENGYLVHHTTTFDPLYEKYSPGLIIISMIGKWVAEHNMTKMEFGDGGEAYKYQFTKQELPLNSIFIAEKYNVPLILKSKIIHKLHSNKRLHAFYADKIRPLLLRSKAAKKMIT